MINGDHNVKSGVWSLLRGQCDGDVKKSLEGNLAGEFFNNINFRLKLLELQF